MQVVIDTVDPEGDCRAFVVEAVSCDGTTLCATKGESTLRIPIAQIANWSPIDDSATLDMPLDDWISRRFDQIAR